MNDTDWILFDTETTGRTAPIFVVELAAQRMRGWQPQGEPFRKLVNQNSAVPREASRVHGYLSMGRTRLLETFKPALTFWPRWFGLSLRNANCAHGATLSL